MTFRECALLTVALLPMLVIIAMQLWLVFYGESGTLLLPSLMRLPSIDISEPRQDASTVSPVMDLSAEVDDALNRKAA
jgi:hypothetical protein